MRENAYYYTIDYKKIFLHSLEICPFEITQKDDFSLGVLF